MILRDNAQFEGGGCKHEGQTSGSQGRCLARGSPTRLRCVLVVETLD